MMMELSLRRRKRGVDFKPPKENQLIEALMYCAIPLANRTALKIDAVKVDEESIARLRRLSGQRAVLTPNHPTDRDPVVIFQLSRLAGERFNYLAARELFDFAPIAWFLQRCGVYSVMRGTNDRKSFRATVELLVEGKRKLVIFPEGLTCWQNDTVMPFQEGVPLFCFWALEKLAKQGPLPPLFLVPIAIKYVHLRNMHREIERALTRLERRLGLSSNHRTLYERLRTIGEAVLASAENEYGVRPGRDVEFDIRLQSIKELLVTRIATALGLSFDQDQALATRIRALVNALNQITHEEPRASGYQLDLHRQRQAEVEPLYNDLSRVLRFVATYDGYVRESMTVERFLDIIGLLEREVFGKKWNRGPCRVHIRVGEPLNLADHFDSYQENRRDVLGRVTAELEHRIKQMLKDLGRFATPL